MHPNSTETDAPTRQWFRSTAFALAAIGALLVAGCSAGGDDPASGTTTSSASGGDETTATGADQDDDGTTTTGGSGRDVTTEDLEALLPDASDVGPAYSVAPEEDDDGDSDAEMEEAMEKACPEAAEFMRDDDDDDGDAAIRSFETSNGQGIEVKLDPTPNPNYAEGIMGDLIRAVDACDTVEVEIDGFSVSIEISATPDDTYGDRGVRMQMLAVMSHPALLAPLELDFSSLSYLVGSVAVSIEASGGIAGQTAEEIRVVPGDHDLVDALAAALEPEVEAVQR